MKKYVLISLLAITGLSSCDKPQSARKSILADSIGKDCVVQFNRNSLGAAANLPVPPMTSSINGADVCVSGKLTQVGDKGIIIERTKGVAAVNQKLWIPEASILLIEFK